MTRWIPFAIVLVFFGCSSDSKKPPVTPPDDGPDTMPPAAISDLAVTATTDSSATLTWTAPGDDGTTGTATRYDLAYHWVPVTEETWAGATHPVPLPTPLVAGTPSTYVVSGIPPGATYYFAIRAADEEYNWSPTSNVVSAAVGPDAVPPDQLDPHVVAVTDSSVTFSWTATGDDWSIGTAAQYDVRYATELDVIRAHWDDAIQAQGEPAPSLAGTTDSFTATGLQPGTSYAIGIKAGDERPNWSQLSWIEARTTDSAADAANVHWLDVFGGGGPDDDVTSLFVYDGALIVGGRFRSAGGNEACGIARWDGATWSAMGAFENSPPAGRSAGPEAFATYNGVLIAGGRFEYIVNPDGGVVRDANHIAQWTNGAWASLAEGFGSNDSEVTCSALAVYNDLLIVGATIVEIGTTYDYIRYWDGQRWRYSGLGGLNGPVKSLAQYNEDLIVGGSFQRTSTIISRYIIRWDGSGLHGWYPMGSWLGQGSDVAVNALAVYHGDLIASGSFGLADHVSCNGIAKWNGSEWSRLGSSNDGYDDAYGFANALVEYHGRLIVGGGYWPALESCIVAWDGTSWLTLGTGIGGPGDVVTALAVQDGRLFVAGRFTRAGDKTVQNVACWED